MVATFGTTEDFQRLLQQQLTDETTNGLFFLIILNKRFLNAHVFLITFTNAIDYFSDFSLTKHYQNIRQKIHTKYIFSNKKASNFF